MTCQQKSLGWGYKIKRQMIRSETGFQPDKVSKRAPHASWAKASTPSVRLGRSPLSSALRAPGWFPSRCDIRQPASLQRVHYDRLLPSASYCCIPPKCMPGSANLALLPTSCFHCIGESSPLSVKRTFKGSVHAGVKQRRHMAWPLWPVRCRLSPLPAMVRFDLDYFPIRET